MTRGIGVESARVLVIAADARVAQLAVGAVDGVLGTGAAVMARADVSAGERIELILADDSWLLSRPNLNFAVDASRMEPGVIALLSRCDAEAADRAVRHGAIDCVVTEDGFERFLGVVIAQNLAAAAQRREDRRAHAELRATIVQLRNRGKALEDSVAHLEAMVMTDPLTKLANRRHIEQRLPQMFAEAVRYGHDLSAMMIDLDGFKLINDTLGHGRGDEILRMTGRIIAESVRQSDLAARYGGDEFLVLMPQTGSETAAQVAERLASVFHRQAALSAKGAVRVGMSIGIACLRVSKPIHGSDLLAHADNALYAAKQAGKSRTMVCGPDGVNAEAA